VRTTYHLTVVALVVTLTACHRDAPSPQPGSTSTSAAPDASIRRVVNVYNWSDYVAPGAIDASEQSSGIKVNYDTFDSQEMPETQLLTGRSGYDVVVVAANILERLAPIGVFRKLDNSRLPSRKNQDRELETALAEFDPGNEHAVGYLWGTTGIGYDERKLRERLPDAPIDSWRLIYDPEVVAKMADCGVSIADAPSEVIATVLMSLGKNPNDLSAAGLSEAERVLRAVRPSVRKIDGDSQIEDLAGGNICLMVTWGTNVFLARARAEAAGQTADFRYVIPREGTVRWIDAFAIPADAPHVAEAHAFIDFMMQPQIAAKNAAYIGNASMNAAAMPLIDPSLRGDRSVYPPADVRARLQPLRARTQAQSREETRVWTAFRGAQ